MRSICDDDSCVRLPLPLLFPRPLKGGTIGPRYSEGVTYMSLEAQEIAAQNRFYLCSSVHQVDMDDDDRSVHQTYNTHAEKSCQEAAVWIKTSTLSQRKGRARMAGDVSSESSLNCHTIGAVGCGFLLSWQWSAGDHGNDKDTRAQLARRPCSTLFSLFVTISPELDVVLEPNIPNIQISLSLSLPSSLSLSLFISLWHWA